jgi:hypothetical protein
MNGADPQAGRTGQSQFDLVAHYAKRIRAERSRMGGVGHSWESPGIGGQTPLRAATGQGA